MAGHAELAPSAAGRWMNCPGSIRLCRDIPPEPPGPYAAAGTATHALAEWAMSEFTTAQSRVGVKMHGVEIDATMAEAADVYVALLRERSPARGWMKLEQKVSLQAMGLPEIYGTADGLLYDEEARRLTVVDLKSGAGVFVGAASPQLKIYALGGLDHLAMGARCDTVECVIVQPRRPDADDDTPGVRSHTLNMAELIDFAGHLKQLAELTTRPEAPLVAGDWCRFCPARRVCPELQAEALAVAQQKFANTPLNDGIPPADTLTNDELSRVLSKAEIVELWIRSVREEASHRIDTGQAVPGWKLVAKRATRKWVDEPRAAAALLALGLPDGLIHITELRSPAQIEKAAPKALRAGLPRIYADHVEAISTGTTLVPEADARPAAIKAVDAFAATPLTPW